MFDKADPGSLVIMRNISYTQHALPEQVTTPSYPESPFLAEPPILHSVGLVVLLLSEKNNPQSLA